MKKIFLFLMMGLFMVSMVSAVSYNYDHNTRKAEFSNTFLFWETGKIATAQLLTPLDYKVGLGEQYVWEMKVEGFDSYQDFISEMDFYDRNNGMAKINKNYDLRKRETIQILVDDLNCNQQQSVNGTFTEVCEVVGNHYKPKVIWTKLKQVDFKKNDILFIRMYVFVEEGDHVEWIPTVAGKKVPEWASWSASLDTLLTSYYEFDETSGTTAYDEKGTNNMANTGVVVNQAGLLNQSYLWNSNGDYLQKAGASGVSTDISFNTRVYLTSINQYDTIVELYDASPDTALQMNFANTTHLQWQCGGSTCGSFTIKADFTSYLNKWTMITGIIDDTSNNMSLYFDGKLVAYDTGTYVGFSEIDEFVLGNADSRVRTRAINGYMDLAGLWGKVLTQSEITELNNTGLGCNYQDCVSSGTSPTVLSISPSNDTKYTISPQSIDFTCYGSDGENFTEMEFYLNGSLTQTNSSGINDTNYIFSETLTDGEYNWSCIGYDDEANSEETEIRILSIDSLSPVISPAFNVTDLVTLSLPINTTWHFNATDTNLDSCYYNTSENATYKIITCNATENTEWATEGTKTIQFCANDTFGFETCNSTSLYIYYITYNQSNNPETVAEGFDATFNLTLNLTSIPTAIANLIINNTVYAPDTTTAGTNGYTFGKTITIPDGWGNTTGIIHDWYWNYSILGVTDANTSTDNITVYELAIDDCSSYTDVILNFTLRNEEDAVPVNESAGANVEISLDLTSKTDENIYLSYSNIWMNENNPQICLPANVLNNSEYWVDLTVGFSSTDHVWEFYYIDQGTLNSTKIIELFNGQTTSSISLMDLLTADSTSFLFNYFDEDGLAVDDAIVHVMRKYIGNGLFLEVERSKADQNGDTIVHLVEEDVIYFFYITQYGQLLHTSSTYTALCQTTPCTIQIEASGDSAEFGTDWDLIDGGAYNIVSTAGSREVNMTYSLNDTSTMNVTVFKYNNDGSYTEVASGSDTGSGGSILLTVPQGAGNVSFFASVYQDEDFVNSEWVDFEEKAQDRMGITLALFLSALIILTLGLMAITEGVGTLVFVVLGVALSGFLGLMTTQLSTGVNIVVYLVVAGGILLYKLTGGRR